MKTILKNILPPKFFYFLKRKLNTQFDERNIIYDFLNFKKGVMFDVGSMDGSSFMPFLLKKWHIFAFEPDKDNYKNINQYLKKWNFKIDLFEKAVSDIEETQIFYKSNASTGIPSLLKFNKDQVPSHEVNTVVLKKIIEKNDINNIDFLKIDVEGYDLMALKGFDFSRLKPRIIMCEFEDKKTKLLNYTVLDMANFLKDKGYYLIYSIWFPIKEYGTQHNFKKMSIDFKDIDFNDWGNIIAFSSETDYEKFKTKHKI
ncbi:MAG: FkbM family methyltransferase [Mariprofundus sp.]|nr:FkbM family methyltransferase [Mariprofundus sp.]